MTTQEQSSIAVIGATGQQGGHVVEALLQEGVAVRALVRDSASPAATALAARGVELVRADQQDVRSTADGLAGVPAFFFMTTFEGPEGPEGEARRGFAVAEAAARAGVPRVVYSSVGGADRGTGIPHFESKWRVEERLRQLVPTTVLRPVFFFENLTPQLAPDANGEIVVRMPMPGDVPVQMIGARDVGRAAARLLLEPEAIAGGAIEVAGDEPTLDRAAAEAGRAFGVPGRYEQLPLEVLGEDEDLKAMFGWFASGDAYRADLEKSRRLVPDLQDLTGWLAAQRPSSAH